LKGKKAGPRKPSSSLKASSKPKTSTGGSTCSLCKYIDSKTSIKKPSNFAVKPWECTLKQVKLWLIKAQILEKQAYIEEARKTYEESIQINKSQHLLYTEFAFLKRDRTISLRQEVS